MSLKFRSSVPKELKLHVREIQLSKNRIRLLEYLKTKCNHNEVLFLQETYSSIKN